MPKFLKLNSSDSQSFEGDAGFTLLELIVSMVIFLMVIGTIWGLLQVGLRSRTNVNQNVSIVKSTRLSLNAIGRDTYNAGYGYPLRNTVVLPDNRISIRLGLPNDFDTSRDTVPPIIAGNEVTLNTFNTAPNVKTDQITFLFKDTTFNLVGTGLDASPQPLNINAATTTSGGIDEIIPISGSNAVCRVNDIYLITGNTGSTLGVSTALSGSNKVQFSNGDVLGFNLTGSTGPLRSITVPASMQRIKMVTYFVTPDGTLTRRDYANRAPVIPAVAHVDEPLIFGVENFQIQYVMDDGSLSDNPSAGVDGIPGNADDVQANLAAVRQVRFTIYVRSTELMPDGQPFRETMTSTFSTRNLGYEAN